MLSFGSGPRTRTCPIGSPDRLRLTRTRPGTDSDVSHRLSRSPSHAHSLRPRRAQSASIDLGDSGRVQCHLLACARVKPLLGTDRRAMHASRQWHRCIRMYDTVTCELCRDTNGGSRIECSGYALSLFCGYCSLTLLWILLSHSFVDITLSLFCGYYSLTRLWIYSLTLLWIYSLTLLWINSLTLLWIYSLTLLWIYSLTLLWILHPGTLRRADASHRLC
jgi:hypothetical protein